jgi:hypothetical protein
VSTEYCFADFLRESFDALRRELPEVHGVMCGCLAEREVELRVGEEIVSLAFTATDVELRPSCGAPAAAVRTSRAGILDLIDARSTLLDSVLAGRLELAGTLDELARFHDGLMAYLHGAMRAPSFRSILRRFRDAESA